METGRGQNKTLTQKHHTGKTKPMSMTEKEEMLPRLRQRYAGRGREGRSRMIDGLSEQFGCSRKHAIQRLNAKAGGGGDPALRKKIPKVSAAQADRLLAPRKARRCCGT